MQFVDDSNIVEPPQKKRKSNGHASSSTIAEADEAEAQSQLSEMFNALQSQSRRRT